MNAVRSPMAAAILRHLAGRRVYVESAGVKAGGPDPFAIAVMDEIGIDIAGHRPSTLQELHDTSFDLIVTLSPEAHHQALELTRTMAVEVEYWPTFDATMMIGHGEPRAGSRRLPGRARPAVPAHQAPLRPRGRPFGVTVSDPGLCLACAGAGPPGLTPWLHLSSRTERCERHSNTRAGTSGREGLSGAGRCTISRQGEEADETGPPALLGRPADRHGTLVVERVASG